MEDLQAIHRLKRGDIGGLEVLVARYQTKAVDMAFLVTQDLALAEHVLHYDVNHPFKPYMMKSVVNAALDAVEKEAKWVHSVMDESTQQPEGGRLLCVITFIMRFLLTIVENTEQLGRQ
ncbi:MAG: hypothetical protein GX544_07760 [Chloroflexi bacterium]|jgi:hypothetical protein|nr:hypothetical protein [Chloroflexota bacterium]